MSANGTKVYDYYDEEFITDNARLTAQCLKFVLNENGIYDFSGKKTAITGYGRTAKAIAEFMKENGAKVLITARDPHALADAVKKGYSICLLRDYDCIAHDADILINTVPAEIIDKNILSRLRKDVLLIDIASPPVRSGYRACRLLRDKRCQSIGASRKIRPRRSRQADI